MMTHQVSTRLRGLVCRESPTPSTTKLLHHKAAPQKTVYQVLCHQAVVPQSRCTTGPLYHKASAAPQPLFRKAAPRRRRTKARKEPQCHKVVVPPSRCTTELLHHKSVAAPKPLYHKTARQRTAMPHAVPQRCRTTKPLTHRAVVPHSRCCPKLLYHEGALQRTAVPVAVPQRCTKETANQSPQRDTAPRSCRTTKPLHYRAAVPQSRRCSQAAVPRSCTTKNCCAKRRHT